MINEKEKKLLEELRIIRFLDSDKEDEDEDEMQDEVEEKVDRYENILFTLSSTKNVEVISELCDIAEDKATELSAVEYLLMTVYKILKSNNIKIGMNEIIKGIKCMVPKAFQKAVTLNIWMLRDDDVRQEYINKLKNLNTEEKETIRSIFKEIIREFGDEYKVKEALKLIE